MQNGNMLQQWGLSQLSAENAAYVEDLYEQYLLSPQSVPEDWRAYFDKLPRVNGLEQDMPHKNVREQFLLLGAQQLPRSADAGQQRLHRARTASGGRAATDRRLP